jgi:signal transduction histidine kinase/CheY-like chemotaxis protein
MGPADIPALTVTTGPVRDSWRVAGGGGRLLTYVSIVAAVGTAAIGLSLYQIATRPVGHQWLLLAALTVASSAAVLRLSSAPVSFSVTEIFTFSAVLLFGPAVGTLTVAIDCLVLSSRLAPRGLPTRRLVLNVTSPPLAMWMAAHVLFALVDVQSLSQQTLSFAEVVLSLSVSALVYYVLNTGMVAIAVALESGQPVFQVWRQHFAHLWVSFFVGAHAAGLLVVSLGDIGISFLALVAPLPLLLYYAMRTWLGRHADQVRYLEEANRQSRELHEQQSLRLQTEMAWRERDRQFRAVFDNALDALLVVDDQRRLVDANPAARTLLNVSRHVLPVAALETFLDPGSAAWIVERWSGILESREHKGELTVGGKSTVEFSFTAGVMPGRHLFIWRDVSERRELEAQLQQSQKMETIGRLAGGIAHDFNNLLTVILGYGQLVKSEVDGPVADQVLEMIRAGERAAALTRQLLAFSRKQALQPAILDLNGIIGDVDRMVRRLLDESIEITTLMDSALWPVKVDPAQFEQVIVNLVVNAGDAMPDGGRLVIETRNVEFRPPVSGPDRSDGVPGPYVLLQVSDTGIGMNDATRAQIFEPFFTTKGEGKGTGLGLSMVYGIVRQSGGHIVIDSVPGAGTTCRIYLPRAAAANVVAGESDRDGSAAGPLRGTETILLVEDETPVRFLARQALERQGYRVLEAASGEEACAIANDHDEIDILVTDVSMPGMNGRQLASTLRARAPDLKIVFISGYSSTSVPMESFKKGAVFCQKPFTGVALAGVVRNLLDGRADAGSDEDRRLPRSV